MYILTWRRWSVLPSLLITRWCWGIWPLFIREADTQSPVSCISLESTWLRWHKSRQETYWTFRASLETSWIVWALTVLLWQDADTHTFFIFHFFDSFWIINFPHRFIHANRIRIQSFIVRWSLHVVFLPPRSSSTRTVLSSLVPITRDCLLLPITWRHQLSHRTMYKIQLLTSLLSILLFSDR